MQKPSRILILGCSGSGKSTLSNAIHQKTNLPIIHLDQAYWKAGWVEPSKEEWEARVQKLIQAPAWIMDGNYSSSLDIRTPRAELIIFLDVPTWKSLWRALKRIWKYHGRVRPDMALGCPERFNWEFMHYILRYNWISRPRILRKLKALPEEKQVFILKSDREVQNLLKAISQ